MNANGAPSSIVRIQGYIHNRLLYHIGRNATIDSCFMSVIYSLYLLENDRRLLCISMNSLNSQITTENAQLPKKKYNTTTKVIFFNEISVSKKKSYKMTLFASQN